MSSRVSSGKSVQGDIGQLFSYLNVDEILHLKDVAFQTYNKKYNGIKYSQIKRNM